MNTFEFDLYALFLNNISISLLTFTANVATCLQNIYTQHETNNQELPRMAQYPKDVKRRAYEPPLNRVASPKHIF